MLGGADLLDNFGAPVVDEFGVEVWVVGEVPL